jgi:hypothetical protein
LYGIEDKESFLARNARYRLRSFLRIRVAVFGAAGGFLIGWAISAYYEEVLGIGNPQGPLLFLLTAPAGFLLGFLYGIWKAIRNRNLYLHFS